jgi:hypothetical protein
MTTQKGYVLYKNEEVVGFTYSEEKRDQWIDSVIEGYDKEKYVPVMKNNKLVIYKKYKVFVGSIEIEEDSYRYEYISVV